MKLPSALYYNFRIGPEGVWLIASSIGGAVLLGLYTTDFSTITDWRTWSLGFLLNLLFRTIPGAILAVVSGGGFQLPGQQASNEPAPAPAEGEPFNG